MKHFLLLFGLFFLLSHAVAAETIELDAGDINSGALERIAHFGSLELAAKFQKDLAAKFQELERKFKNGDELDENALQRPIIANKEDITAKQKENRTKTFVFYLPYQADKIDVSDTEMSADLIVRTGMSLDGKTGVETSLNGVKTQDLKIAAKKIALPVSGPTEIITTLVNDPNKYEVQLTVEDLRWDNGVQAKITGVSIQNRDERLEKKWANLKSQELTIKGVKFRFRECPAGSFNQGKRHITLSKGFWLGEMEVTQEQWQAVMGNNPSNFKGANLPVEQMSWDDCQEFIEKLNALKVAPAGFTFALPTEAQWEYACRAGSITDYYFGNDADKLDDYAWYSGNSGNKTHEVGGKKPNVWGLYDMHGNVEEWCLDGAGDYPMGDVVDPICKPFTSYRLVYRGGSWFNHAGACRSVSGRASAQGTRFNFLGLRVALVETPVESPALLKAGSLLELKLKDVNFRFRVCPAGSFERDRYKVTLSKDFWMGETEVTQEQWQAVTGENPSNFKGAKLPVENVSWDDCQEFIAKLNAQNAAPAGFKFALPTEAQWEYACRARSTTTYCFGDDTGKLADYAWYVKNSGNKTHEAGGKKPNVWGLYDMHGNVYEWCQDGSGDYPRGDVVDPIYDAIANYRVFRGGCWQHNAENCWPTNRRGYAPKARFNFLGLRLAIVAARETPVESSALGKLLELKLKDVNFYFRECPAGSFERNDHKVTLTQGFWMGEMEVTQEQWQAVMEDNPSHFKGANLPVEMVNWDDCQEFIKKLNNMNVPNKPAGFVFSLPTEAQWEYACRAGSTTDYCFGDDNSQLDGYAWHGGNSVNKTHEVGGKKPNVWGLYDMHGNVEEWCQDWYGEYPDSDVIDPIGASSGIERVFRGSCWNLYNARSADRNHRFPEIRFASIGVRLALVKSDK